MNVAYEVNFLEILEHTPYMPYSNPTSPKNIASLALLILAILTIGWIAMWGARNAPVKGAFSVFPRDDIVLSAYSFNKSRLVYVTNIKTGKSVSRSFHGDHSQQCGWDDSKFWVINHSADEKSVFRHEWNFDDDQPISTTVFPFDMEDYRRFHNRLVLVGNTILCVRFNKLESYAPNTGQLLDSLALASPDSSPYASSWLFPELPPNRLLLTQASKSQYSELFDVSDDGKLKSIVKWTAIDSYTFRQDDSFYVASLLPGGMTVEVRDASDGEMVSSTTFPPDPTLPLPLSRLSSHVKGTWIGFPIFAVERDVFTGLELPVPSQFNLLVRDMKNKKLVAISKANRPDPQRTVVMLDEMTGAELSKFPVDPKCWEAKYLRDSSELALATSDLRVFIYDVKTGQLLRTIDPYKLVRWSRIGVTLAFVLWCVLWVRFASTIHSLAWIDTAVCIALFSTYGTYCSYHDVTFLFPQNIFMLGIGALFGAIFLTCIWTVLGRTRFSLRLMPLLLSFGLSEGFVVWWVPENRIESIESNLVPAISIATLICIVSLLPLRWLGVRFGQTESTLIGEQLVASDRQTRIDLRDIFLMTVVCAILFSIFRLIPSTHWYEFLYFDVVSPNSYSRDRARFIIGAGIFSGLFLCVGIFGLWISMGRQSYLWISGLVAFFLLFIMREFYLPLTWTPIVIIVGSAYLTSLLGFYSYRSRGWRLARSPITQARTLESD